MLLKLMKLCELMGAPLLCGDAEPVAAARRPANAYTAVSKHNLKALQMLDSEWTSTASAPMASEGSAPKSKGPGKRRKSKTSQPGKRKVTKPMHPRAQRP